jgi:hypothetical protein
MKKSIVLSAALMMCVLSLIAQNSSDPEGARILPGQHKTIQESRPLQNPASDPFQTLNEGFDNVSTLIPGGWAMINMSSPMGSTGWYQGVSSVFVAYDGAPEAYIAANYNNTSGAGTISNWLITPVYTIHNGDVMTFYTRTASGSLWPDRLEVRLSISGNSTNVGTTELSVGDFSTLLLSINPNLVVHGYPEAWTQLTVTVSGLPDVETGRFAFRYFVTDGGPIGDNSNYIGIDRVQFQETATVPVSGWAIAIGIGLILAFSIIRIRKIA